LRAALPGDVKVGCLVYPVCLPRLLEARCNSIEEMEPVNALRELTERAERTPI
jgi:hypothetical protein